jgi:hypothetical protein
MQPDDLGLSLHHRRGEAGASLAEEDAQSETPEWKLRERRGRDEDRRVEAEELGEKQPLFLPTPSFMAFAEEG